jgi:hypothetical protein
MLKQEINIKIRIFKGDAPFSGASLDVKKQISLKSN